MKITSIVKKALLLELKKMFENQPVTVIYNTNLQKNNNPIYTLPLVIFGAKISNDTKRMPNGITELNLDFSISVYTYEPNPELTDDNDYSLSLEDIFDEIRQYFSLKQFQTSEIKDIINNYSFNYVLNDIVDADPIENDEVNLIGYKLNYSGLFYDISTISEPLSNSTLLNVIQIQ